VPRMNIESEVINIEPCLSVADGFFYLRPTNHVMCGFVLDVTPSSFRIWRYSLPICDKLDFLHLSFGAVLPGGYLPRTGKAKLSAGRFLDIVRPFFDDVRKLSNLRTFIETSSEAINLYVPIARRGLAAALLLSGDRQGAIDNARICLEEGGSLSLDFLNDTKLLLGKLESGAEDANVLLENWEHQTRLRFKIH
jgi:hypothetical protein